jgi:DNA-binding XRE family transcriptional regulator
MTLIQEPVTLEAALKRANQLRERRDLQLRHLRATEDEMRAWAEYLVMRAHMNQTRVAKELGVHRRTMTQWINLARAANGRAVKEELASERNKP